MNKRKKLKISGVAKGQYKQVCDLSWSKCHGDEEQLSFKIRRAVNLGAETHTFQNGCRIIRYYYLNFLVDDGEIMTMWSDHSCLPHVISERDKELYDDLFWNRKLNFGEISSFIERMKNR